MAAGDLNKNINIGFNLFIKGQAAIVGAFDNIKKAANSIKANTRGVTTGLQAVEDSIQGIHSADLPGEYADMQKGMKGTGNALKRFMGGYNRARMGMGRFHMELLSVMFAGMALNKVMMGLLQPAMQAAGIFDLWSAILTILFLPIVLAMLPFLLDLLDWVNSLSENDKKLIGTLVILGAALGFVLMMFGQLGLAIGGIHTVIGGLSAGFKALGIGSTAMSGQMTLFGTSASAAGTSASASLLPIILIIGAIVAILLILNEMWKSNFGDIRGHVGRFLQWFSGVYETVFKPILDFMGKGIIFLVNVIDFAMRNASALWERVWLQIYASAATVWNMLLTGIEIFVNGMLTPLKILWDSLAGLAELVGINVPKFPTLNLNQWKVELGDVEKRVAELDKELGANFMDTMIETQKQTDAWTQGLDEATGAILHLGKEVEASGAAIDAGLDEGKGFIPGLEGGLLGGGITAPTTPIPVTGGGVVNNIKYDSTVNLEGDAYGDIDKLIDEKLQENENRVIDIVDSMSRSR